MSTKRIAYRLASMFKLACGFVIIAWLLLAGPAVQGGDDCVDDADAEKKLKELVDNISPLYWKAEQIALLEETLEELQIKIKNPAVLARHGLNLPRFITKKRGGISIGRLWRGPSGLPNKFPTLWNGSIFIQTSSGLAAP